MSTLPDTYLRADSAAMFGKLGRDVEQALAAYAAAPAENAAVHTDMLHAAADAVWRYFVVREACGLNDHTPIIETYAIPPDVLARVGTPKPAFPR
ncbi:MAG: hypothetical protein K2R93_21565 [Gemmatimonadaceae bacterium]|nr:hypothetical protein [Gemmatimonadaceae bacterium]